MSNSKKYPSKYSNGKEVSAAQYITEIICERMAAKDKKDLHYRFWLNKEWNRYYRNQIASANKLLTKYSDAAIIKALNSRKAEKIYSLRAPHLPAIIEQAQAELDKQNNELSIVVNRSSDLKFGRNTNKTNIISKLKGLDDEPKG